MEEYDRRISGERCRETVKMETRRQGRKVGGKMYIQIWKRQRQQCGGNRFTFAWKRNREERSLFTPDAVRHFSRFASSLGVSQNHNKSRVLTPRLLHFCYHRNVQHSVQSKTVALCEETKLPNFSGHFFIK